MRKLAVHSLAGLKVLQLQSTTAKKHTRHKEHPPLLHMYMYMYMYVYVYVYVYIYICIHVHISIQMHIYTYIDIQIHIHMYIQTIEPWNRQLHTWLNLVNSRAHTHTHTHKLQSGQTDHYFLDSLSTIDPHSPCTLNPERVWMVMIRTGACWMSKLSSAL